MKTNLTDTELLKLKYKYNMTKSYLFKSLENNNAVFIDVKTRNVDIIFYNEEIKTVLKELKIEVE